MKININVDNSIASSKLKYKFRSRYELLDHILFIVFSLLLICVAVVITNSVSKIYYKSPSWGVLLFTFFLLITGILSLYTLLTFDKLIQFKGSSQEENSKILSDLIEQHFGSRPAPSIKHLKFYRQPGFWKTGKRVVVIFNGENILMNIATFNSNNIRSPLHGFFDHIKIYTIKKEFKQLLIKY